MLSLVRGVATLTSRRHQPVCALSTAASEAAPTPAAKPAKMVKFEVYRYQPDDEGKGKPYVQYFDVNTAELGGLMILDALLKIKNEMDSTLTFRRSCREGICGSCAMNISGRNTLACLKGIEEAAEEGPGGVVTVYPLPHLPVIKDLVPDMNLFYQHHASVKPWLQRKTADAPDKEIRQSIAERERLDGLYECILCACCSTSCPSYWWNSHMGYLGPAALMQAYRWIADSRDEYTTERLLDLHEGNKHTDLRMEACHQIMNCTKTCPKHLAPGRAIGQIRAQDPMADNAKRVFAAPEQEQGWKKTILDIIAN